MHIPLTRLLLLQSLIFSAVTSSSLRLPQNNSYTISASPSALNLTAPDPPPGFRADVSFDRSQRLHPIWYYLVVAAAMKELVQRPWDSPVDSSFIFKLIIKVVAEPTVIGPRSQLRISHAILALNEAVMRAMPENLFFNTHVAISLQGNPIGRLGITFERPFPVEKEDGNATRSLTADSGTVQDPQYPDYRIVWEYRGSKVNSKDLFLAVLDGLATAAQPQGQSRCHVLDAISPLSYTGQAIIWVREETAPGVSSSLVYDDVILAIYLIWRDVSVGLNKFGEMTFDIYYRGVKRGSGEIIKLPPVAVASS